jgi:hypothetical protein
VIFHEIHGPFCFLCSCWHSKESTARLTADHPSASAAGGERWFLQDCPTLRCVKRGHKSGQRQMWKERNEPHSDCLHSRNHSRKCVGSLGTSQIVIRTHRLRLTVVWQGKTRGRLNRSIHCAAAPNFRQDMPSAVGGVYARMQNVGEANAATWAVVGLPIYLSGLGN